MSHKGFFGFAAPPEATGVGVFFCLSLEFRQQVLGPGEFSEVLKDSLKLEDGRLFNGL